MWDVEIVRMRLLKPHGYDQRDFTSLEPKWFLVKPLWDRIWHFYIIKS